MQGCEADRNHSHALVSDFTAVAILGRFQDHAATAAVERVLNTIAKARAAEILKVS